MSIPEPIFVPSPSMHADHDAEDHETPPPTPLLSPPPADLTGCVKTAKGCGVAIVAALVLLVGGSLLWWALTPRDVGYDDVLTPQNAQTFANHNKDWDSDNPHNTDYARGAIANLGDRAYGHTFGDLMDWEQYYQGVRIDPPSNWLATDLRLNDQAKRKHDELAREQTAEQKQEAYEQAHPTPRPPVAFVPIGSEARTAATIPCWDSPEALDEAVKDLAANDKVGFDEVFVSNGLVLAQGTSVLAIDRRGLLGESVQVRVLNGPHFGMACWFAAGPAAFLDVHEHT